MTNQYLWTDNPTESGIAKCDTDVLNDCLMHLKYENQPVDLIQDVENLKVDKAGINADNFTAAGVQNLIQMGIPDWENRAKLNVSLGFKYTCPKDGLIHAWVINRNEHQSTALSISLIDENNDIVMSTILYAWYTNIQSGGVQTIPLKKGSILTVDQYTISTNSSILVQFVPFKGES